MDIEIKRVEPGLLDDFLNFFDHVAFSDNPDWASCYCHCYHSDLSWEAWEKRTAAENREASRDLVLNGGMQGFLAYLDGKPVGWCNAAPKSNYQRLMAMENQCRDEGKTEPDRPPLEETGAVVCFVVAPGYRKKGVARKLLESACDRFQKDGYRYVEAYPAKEDRSNAHNYPGPLSMYLDSGFTVVEDDGENLLVGRELLP